MKDFRRAFIVMTPRFKIRFKILALLGLSLSLSLAGCGRKGSLETPGAYQPQQETAATDPATAAEPVQAETPESDKSFFLDFLIK